MQIGLDPTAYDTHTIRRRKASFIYRRTKNIRAVQLLLGHTKLESTVRYLGTEVNDALNFLQNGGVKAPTQPVMEVIFFWLPVTGHSRIATAGL